MIIVGVSRFHNASVCLIKDGEIIFHIDNERLSNVKYDRYPFLAMSKIKEYVDHVDIVAISGLGPMTVAEYFDDSDIYTTFIKSLGKSFYENPIKTYNFGMEHHLMHASCAFYNSGFKEAVCIVKDGMGSEVKLEYPIFEKGTYGRQNMSIFKASYPDKFNTVYEEVVVPFKTDPIKIENKFIVNSISEGLAYEKTSEKFGFHALDAGKVMGMSSYGKNTTRFPDIYINNEINKDIFTINNSLKNVSLNIEFDGFQDQADFAKHLQESIQNNVKKQIIDTYNLTKIKNICLTGGYFLNCVANYEFLKDIPEEINIYIEPISSDSGTAIGAAKLAWHKENKDKTIRKQSSIYYGPTNNYTPFGNKTSSSEVARLLYEGKIIAIYQGRSESGPRALGNRSILFDPRVSDGKDIVNKVKNREWFRPFAGTVLLEECNNWFDMRGLKESPYMMYAVNVLKDKRSQIPAITHIDGTCRVQTLSMDQNPAYYELINEFYKLTEVPILFNTSFNLAGDCIVETYEDAIRTLNNSDIDYLYLPEYNILIN